MAVLDAQQNFMLSRYYFIAPFLLNRKYGVFCGKFAKLNKLSMIAIDLIKIFKYTKICLSYLNKDPTKRMTY